MKLYQLDALTLLKSLPSESVDLILTDPPYASLEAHRSVGTTTRLKGQWFPVVQDEYFGPLMRELVRVMKPGAHAYVFSDAQSSSMIRAAGEAHGLHWWKFLVWDKVSIGMGYHYRGRFELVHFFEKRSRTHKRRLTSLSVPDVLEFKRVRGGYPTEKPVDLLKLLIEQSTDEGAVVCDPFMGSGSTGIAAIDLKREFIGGDLNHAAQLEIHLRLTGGE